MSTVSTGRRCSTAWLTVMPIAAMRFTTPAPACGPPSGRTTSVPAVRSYGSQLVERCSGLRRPGTRTSCGRAGRPRRCPAAQRCPPAPEPWRRSGSPDPLACPRPSCPPGTATRRAARVQTTRPCALVAGASKSGPHDGRCRGTEPSASRGTEPSATGAEQRAQQHLPHRLAHQGAALLQEVARSSQEDASWETPRNRTVPYPSMWSDIKRTGPIDLRPQAIWFCGRVSR